MKPSIYDKKSNQISTWNQTRTWLKATKAMGEVKHSKQHLKGSIDTFTTAHKLGIILLYNDFTDYSVFEPVCEILKLHE